MFKKIWNWLVSLFYKKKEPLQPTATIVKPSKQAEYSVNAMAHDHNPIWLSPKHRDRFSDIGPDAFIENTSDIAITLEGGVIRRIVIPPHSKIRIPSPVLERIQDFQSQRMEIEFYLREWDALEIAEDLVMSALPIHGGNSEFVYRTKEGPISERGSRSDILADLAEKKGLRAYRET